MPASPPLRSVVNDQKHDGATHSGDQPLVEADDLNGDELRRNARWTTAEGSKERWSRQTCLSTPIESCRQRIWGSTTFPRPRTLPLHIDSSATSVSLSRVGAKFKLYSAQRDACPGDRCSTTVGSTTPATAPAPPIQKSP